MKSEIETNIPVQFERRDFHRRKLQAPLEIEWGSSTLTGTLRDIGPRGLFVELTPPLWMGATFSANLLVNPPIKMSCTVCRIEPGKGFGVKFDPLDESGKAQLETFLNTLPKV